MARDIRLRLIKLFGRFHRLQFTLLSMAVLVAAICATLAWVNPYPQYESVALLRVSGVEGLIFADPGGIEFYIPFRILTDARILHAGLERAGLDPGVDMQSIERRRDWPELYKRLSHDLQMDFPFGKDPRQARRELIRVRLVGRNPKRLQQIVQGICDGALKIWQQDHLQSTKSRLEYSRTEYQRYDAEVAQLERRLQRVAGRMDTLDPATKRSVPNWEYELRQAKAARDRCKQEIAECQRAFALPPYPHVTMVRPAEVRRLGWRFFTPRETSPSPW